VVLVVALATFAFVACDDDDGAEPTATPATEIPVAGSPTADATAPQPGGQPRVSVDNVILACREQDAAAVRQFITEDVRAEVTDEQIEEMFGGGTDVRAVSQSTETQTVNGVGTATVTVRLEVTHDDGETETIDREWQLEREGDGVWRFTALPECF
jgi:hypothetical protein